MIRNIIILTLLILSILLHSFSYAETKRPYIKFCGAAQMVGGACMLIDTGKSRVLVDFGIFYGMQYEAMNKEIPFDPSSIDHVILTHGHLDHSGRIPFLYKKGFKGKVYSTDATKDITEIMLNMNLGIMREQGKILYETEDLMKALVSLQSVLYDKPNKITDDITITFRDAGHILGSAIAEIVINTTNGNTKIIATGDMGYSNMPIIREHSLIFNQRRRLCNRRIDLWSKEKKTHRL